MSKLAVGKSNDDFERSVLQHWPQVIVDDGQDPVAMAGLDRMIYHLSAQDKATNQPNHRLIFWWKLWFFVMLIVNFVGLFSGD